MPCKYSFLKDEVIDDYAGWGARNSCPHGKRFWHKTCIFHDPNPEKDSYVFWKALDAYIADVEADDNAERYTFHGFIFPRTYYYIFASRKFKKEADFRYAQFLEETDFYGTQFLKGADFQHAQFLNQVDFRYAQFLKGADFQHVQFLKGADFQNAQFLNQVDFRYAQFLKGADFQHVQFLKGADFQNAQFSEEVYFDNAKFSECANFIDATFEQRLIFTNTKFHDEITFQNAEIAFLKYLGAKNANFEGAVLESAQFWGIEALENYHFKDAFLLGLSLAGKRLVNCDFTGAVFTGCHVRAEDFDEATIANTKYIYTDYEIVDSGFGDLGMGFGDQDSGFRDRENVGAQHVAPEEHVAPENRQSKIGNPKSKYRAIEESRIPADGNFGEGDNAGFTIADYFYKPFEWNFSMNLPEEMRTTLLNTIQFFKEYHQKVRNESVDIQTKPEGKKVRIVFFMENEADKELVQASFKEYLNLMLQPFDEVSLDFRNSSLSVLEQEDFEDQFMLEKDKLKLDLQRARWRLKAKDQSIKNLERQLGVAEGRIDALITKPSAPIHFSPTLIATAKATAIATVHFDTEGVLMALSELREHIQELRNVAGEEIKGLEGIEKSLQRMETAVEQEGETSVQDKKSVWENLKGKLDSLDKMNGATDMMEKAGKIAIEICKMMGKLKNMGVPIDDLPNLT